VSEIGQVAAVAAVVMGMAHTLTKERIFAPLRDALGGKETWLGYLVSCPYCASHYIAFLIVPLTGTFPLRVAVDWGVGTAVLNWFLSSILITVLAAFLRIVFYFVDEKQGLTRSEKEQIRRETQKLELERENERESESENQNRRDRSGAANGRFESHPV
jgi:CBS domain containing-hemolysin-like protein